MCVAARIPFCVNSYGVLLASAIDSLPEYLPVYVERAVAVVACRAQYLLVRVFHSASKCFQRCQVDVGGERAVVDAYFRL